MNEKCAESVSGPSIEEAAATDVGSHAPPVAMDRGSTREAAREKLRSKSLFVAVRVCDSNAVLARLCVAGQCTTTQERRL